MAVLSQTRCVVLAAGPPGGLAEDVRAALEALGWRPWQAGDALTAMADLCVLSRTLATRESAGRGAGESLALLVVEPGRWGELSVFAGAVRRYLPAVSLWAFERGQIAAYGPAAGGAGPDGEARAAAPEAPAPRRREAESAEGAGPVEPVAITREEIEMLLGTERADGT